MKQLAIELSPVPALGRADFVRAACNEVALGWIERWPAWPGRALVLYGPPQCGKTHLLHLWRELSGGSLVAADKWGTVEPDRLAATGAVAVDDAEEAPEEALLHLCNCLNETGGSLVLTAGTAPAGWPTALPDLASRLRAMPAVAIMPPDDSLLSALLVKHFADRQLRVAPAVLAYLVPRMERSFAAAAALTARLDRAALDTGRPIGLALARHVLAEDAR